MERKPKETVGEHYKDAVHYGFKLYEHYIEFLVFERKVLTLEDDADLLLGYYYQPKFEKKMNEYFSDYLARQRKKGEKP